MTDEEIESARRDIEATSDLLERAMKLSGLVTTLFQERGFPLVVVGGSAVEFYTEGGYMSGDIDFCRRSLKVLTFQHRAGVRLYTWSCDLAQPCVFGKQLPGPILCASIAGGPLIPKLRGQFA